MFYLPEGGLVFDPTCGIKNRQFKWIQNSRLDGVKYEYLPGDIQESSLQDLQASVTHIPLKYRSVDLTLCSRSQGLSEKGRLWNNTRSKR